MIRLKRTNFVLIVLTAAFAEGHYLRPLGVGWVIASVALTIVVAIAWMRWRWTENCFSGSSNEALSLALYSHYESGH